MPKPLSDEHRRVMEELVAEHAFVRDTTTRLVDAKSRYVDGDTGALTEIIDCFFTLTDFYPKHVEREDRHFFTSAMDYFSKEEQGRMLAEESEFDRGFVQKHYGTVVEGWEKDAGPSEVPGL